MKFHRNIAQFQDITMWIAYFLCTDDRIWLHYKQNTQNVCSEYSSIEHAIHCNCSLPSYQISCVLCCSILSNNRSLLLLNLGNYRAKYQTISTLSVRLHFYQLCIQSISYQSVQRYRKDGGYKSHRGWKYAGSRDQSGSKCS